MTDKAGEKPEDKPQPEVVEGEPPVKPLTAPILTGADNGLLSARAPQRTAEEDLAEYNLGQNRGSAESILGWVYRKGNAILGDGSSVIADSANATRKVEDGKITFTDANGKVIVVNHDIKPDLSNINGRTINGVKYEKIGENEWRLTENGVVTVVNERTMPGTKVSDQIFNRVLPHMITSMNIDGNTYQRTGDNRWKVTTRDGQTSEFNGNVSLKDSVKGIYEIDNFDTNTRQLFDVRSGATTTEKFSNRDRVPPSADGAQDRVLDYRMLTVNGRLIKVTTPTGEFSGDQLISDRERVTAEMRTLGFDYKEGDVLVRVPDVCGQRNIIFRADGSRIEQDSGRYALRYNSAGRLIERSNPSGEIIESYDYDQAGSLTRVSLPKAGIEYTRTAAANVTGGYDTWTQRGREGSFQARISTGADGRLVIDEPGKMTTILSNGVKIESAKLGPERPGGPERYGNTTIYKPDGTEAARQVIENGITTITAGNQRYEVAADGTVKYFVNDTLSGQFRGSVRLDQTGNIRIKDDAKANEVVITADGRSVESQLDTSNLQFRDNRDRTGRIITQATDRFGGRFEYTYAQDESITGFKLPNGETWQLKPGTTDVWQRTDRQAPEQRLQVRLDQNTGELTINTADDARGRTRIFDMNGVETVAYREANKLVYVNGQLDRIQQPNGQFLQVLSNESGIQRITFPAREGSINARPPLEVGKDGISEIKVEENGDLTYKRNGVSITERADGTRITWAGDPSMQEFSEIVTRRINPSTGAPEEITIKKTIGSSDTYTINGVPATYVGYDRITGRLTVQEGQPGGPVHGATRVYDNRGRLVAFQGDLGRVDFRYELGSNVVNQVSEEGATWTRVKGPDGEYQWRKEGTNEVATTVNLQSGLTIDSSGKVSELSGPSMGVGDGNNLPIEYLADGSPVRVKTTIRPDGIRVVSYFSIPGTRYSQDGRRLQSVYLDQNDRVIRTERDSVTTRYQWEGDKLTAITSSDPTLSWVRGENNVWRRVSNIGTGPNALQDRGETWDNVTVDRNGFEIWTAQDREKKVFPGGLVKLTQADGSLIVRPPGGANVEYAVHRNPLISIEGNDFVIKTPDGRSQTRLRQQGNDVVLTRPDGSVETLSGHYFRTDEVGNVVLYKKSTDRNVPDSPVRTYMGAYTAEWTTDPKTNRSTVTKVIDSTGRELRADNIRYDFGFLLLQNNGGQPVVLSPTRVAEVQSNGNVTVYEPGGGIYKYDRNTGQVTHLRADLATMTMVKDQQNSFKGFIQADSQGNIFIFNETTNKVTAFRSGGGEDANMTRDLRLEYPNGYLTLGPRPGQLTFNPKSGSPIVFDGDINFINGQAQIIFNNPDQRRNFEALSRAVGADNLQRRIVLGDDPHAPNAPYLVEGPEPGQVTYFDRFGSPTILQGHLFKTEIVNGVEVKTNVEIAVTGIPASLAELDTQLRNTKFSELVTMRPPSTVNEEFVTQDGRRLRPDSFAVLPALSIRASTIGAGNFLNNAPAPPENGRTLNIENPPDPRGLRRDGLNDTGFPPGDLEAQRAAAAQRAQEKAARDFVAQVPALVAAGVKESEIMEYLKTGRLPDNANPMLRNLVDRIGSRVQLSPVQMAEISKQIITSQAMREALIYNPRGVAALFNPNTSEEAARNLIRDNPELARLQSLGLLNPSNMAATAETLKKAVSSMVAAAGFEHFRSPIERAAADAFKNEISAMARQNGRTDQAFNQIYNQLVKPHEAAEAAITAERRQAREIANNIDQITRKERELESIANNPAFASRAETLRKEIAQLREEQPRLYRAQAELTARAEAAVREREAIREDARVVREAHARFEEVKTAVERQMLAERRTEKTEEEKLRLQRAQEQYEKTIADVAFNNGMLLRRDAQGKLTMVPIRNNDSFPPLNEIVHPRALDRIIEGHNVPLPRFMADGNTTADAFNNAIRQALSQSDVGAIAAAMARNMPREISAIAQQLIEIQIRQFNRSALDFLPNFMLTGDVNPTKVTERAVGTRLVTLPIDLNVKFASFMTERGFTNVIGADGTLISINRALANPRLLATLLANNQISINVLNGLLASSDMVRMLNMGLPVGFNYTQLVNLCNPDMLRYFSMNFDGVNRGFNVLLGAAGGLVYTSQNGVLVPIKLNSFGDGVFISSINGQKIITEAINCNSQFVTISTSKGRLDDDEDDEDEEDDLVSGSGSKEDFGGKIPTALPQAQQTQQPVNQDPTAVLNSQMPVPLPDFLIFPDGSMEPMPSNWKTKANHDHGLVDVIDEHGKVKHVIDAKGNVLTDAEIQRAKEMKEAARRAEAQNHNSDFSPTAHAPIGGLNVPLQGSDMDLNLGMSMGLDMDLSGLDMNVANQGQGAYIDNDIADNLAFLQGLPVDPNTGFPYDPTTGYLLNPNTGDIIGNINDQTASSTSSVNPFDGRLVDPETGFPYDPVTGIMYDPLTGNPVGSVSNALKSGEMTDISNEIAVIQDNIESRIDDISAYSHVQDALNVEDVEDLPHEVVSELATRPESMDFGTDDEYKEKEKARLDNILNQIEEEEKRLEEQEEELRKRRDEIERLTKLMNSLLATRRQSELDRIRRLIEQQRKIEEFIAKDIRRIKYVVRKGDTLESIAKKHFRDPRLARLIYEMNPAKIRKSTEEGKTAYEIEVGATLTLPSPRQAREWISRGKYLTTVDNNFVAQSEVSSEDLAKIEKRRMNVENVLGALGMAADSNYKPNYTVRFGDSLRSIAMKHPALNDVSLWRLLAKVNNLSVETDAMGTPKVSLERGIALILPSKEEIAQFRKDNGALVHPSSLKSPNGVDFLTNVSVFKECPACKENTPSGVCLCHNCGHVFQDADQSGSGSNTKISTVSNQVPLTGVSASTEHDPLAPLPNPEVKDNVHTFELPDSERKVANSDVTPVAKTEVDPNGVPNISQAANPSSITQKLNDPGQRGSEPRSARTGHTADSLMNSLAGMHRARREASANKNAIPSRQYNMSKLVETLSDSCRIVLLDAEIKPGIDRAERWQLEVMKDGEWTAVVAYEIVGESSIRHEYNVNGKARKSIKMDLPPQAVEEMVRNDLSRNWEDYCKKFLDGKKLSQ